MVNPGDYDGDSYTVGFHGCVCSSDKLKEYFTDISASFAAEGTPPNISLVLAPNWAKKPLTHAYVQRKILQTRIENAKQLTITAQDANRKLLVTTTCMVSANTVVITMAGGRFGRPLKSHAAVAIRSFYPKYGISFACPAWAGPGLYTVGINRAKSYADAVAAISDPVAVQYSRRVSRWGHTAMPARVWERGLLRDLYPWNFLTAPHLTAKVDDVPLQQWVEADPARGTLTSMENGVVLWEVAEQSMPAIRDVLFKAGRIYDWPSIV